MESTDVSLAVVGVVGEPVRSIFCSCSVDVGQPIGEFWLVGEMVRSITESLEVEFVREITGELPWLVNELMPILLLQ